MLFTRVFTVLFVSLLFLVCYYFVSIMFSHFRRPYWTWTNDNIDTINHNINYTENNNKSNRHGESPTGSVAWAGTSVFSLLENGKMFKKSEAANYKLIVVTYYSPKEWQCHTGIQVFAPDRKISGRLCPSLLGNWDFYGFSRPNRPNPFCVLCAS